MVSVQRNGISGRVNNRNEDSELRHQVLNGNSEKCSLDRVKERSIYTIGRENSKRMDRLYSKIFSFR